MLSQWLIRHHTPKRPGLLVLVATILSASYRTSGFWSLSWVTLEKGSGIGVQAASCNASFVEGVPTSSAQIVTVTNGTEFNLSTLFSCEDGEFNVSWSGVVQVSSTINIGRGTTVRIFGEKIASSASTINSTVSSLNILTSTSARSIDSSSSKSSSVGDDLQLNLEMLFDGLNVPQLTSAAEGVHGDDPFGPIFFVDGGELHLEDVAIRNGNATTNSTRNTIVLGGGVYAIESNISVSSCVFEDNFAEVYGGGLHTNRSTVTVRDSVFRGNKAGFQPSVNDESSDGAGGGMGIEESTIYVDGCMFLNNYASKKGGGMALGRVQASVVNSLFFNNLVGRDNIESEEAMGEGGALAISSCNLSFDGLSSCGVNDTKFVYNTAGKKGGAVIVSSGFNISSVEFHRCLIHNCTSGWPFEDDPQGEGGAFVVGGTATTLLEDCMVTNNYCGKKGGAILLSSGESWEIPGATMIIRNSTFEGNLADLDNAGVVYLSEFARVHFEGGGNNFTKNVCNIYGGVVAATTDTIITVEGGLFDENHADERGGVFWTKGELTITGGNFSGNDGSEKGGVVLASEESYVTLYNGYFEGNIANDGGVVFVDDGATLVVQGGVYMKNEARNGGGVFWGGDDGEVEITGGTFTENEADFGGFLYVEGDGSTSCIGATVQKNNAVDGGAIYAVDDAVLYWACALIGNEAITGPAIYAREDANITIRGVNISDNVIALGSVVFVVSSYVHTDDVVFSDSTGSTDLYAVHLDSDSMYVAENTTFDGFQGERVIFSKGTLVLDDCDFSSSPASMLVSVEESSSKPVIRNAIVGDKNFEAAIQEASAASEIPVNASLINVVLTCEESEPACSNGSTCLEGEFGIYCQCYDQYLSKENTGKTTCLTGNPERLFLSEKSPPPITFYPSLLEGDLLVRLDNDGTSSSSSEILPTTTSNTTSHQTSEGVMWNITDESGFWTTFPSVGLLYPGQSITVRVVSRPDVYFIDGNSTATFTTIGIGAPMESPYVSSSIQRKETEDGVTSASLSDSDIGAGTVRLNMNFTYFHCKEANFWNVTLQSDGGNASCELCTDIVGDHTKSLDCSEPGVSTRNLPIQSGYWRASLDVTAIRECFNEDACVGGDDVQSVQDYCATGYEGPFCGVCSSGYGRSSANICHKCTAEFQGVVYFFFALGVLISVIVTVLLGIYLVGGRIAVSQTVSSMMQLSSASGLFRRSEVSDGNDIGARPSSPAHINVVYNKRLVGLPASESKMDEICDRNDQCSVKNAVGSPHAGSWASDAPRNVPGSASYPASGLGSASALTPALAREEKQRASGVSSDVGVRRVPDSAAARGSREDGTVLTLTPRDGDRKYKKFTMQKNKGAKGRTEGYWKMGKTAEGRQRTASTVIGELLGKLPLSKLKIVIVVWQISSAFSDITEVPFPAVYDKFLSVIGIFTFDLSWILSATCLNVGYDFYDELLIVTLGPVFLLGLLSITFSLGARSETPSSWNPLNAIGSNNTGVKTFPAFTWNVRKSNNVRGQTVGTEEKNKMGVGDESRIAHPGGMASMITVPESGASEMKVDEIATTNNRLDEVSSMVEATQNDTSSGASSSEGGVQSVNKNNGDRNPAHPRSASRALSTNTGSIWSVWKDGPGDNAHLEQNRLWRLFARHTTMMLIILYLIYSSVSTVVFQTFVCEELKEIGKSYLRADFRIVCDTPKHNAYKIYAAIMICVYPLGIPAAFCYFLTRQKSRLDPPTDADVKDKRVDAVLSDKMEKRKDDQTVAPTSFLWAAYMPNRYYFEVYECLRRLLLTGLLVFLAPGTGVQVAYSCLFAFLSLLGFELLQPHVDYLEKMLYRTGCLVIFFTNYLALMIKAELADPDSNSATVYAVGLIIVNICFFLSIWWNAFATIRATFSGSHVQGVLLGVDIIGEDKMGTLLTVMKGKGAKGRRDEVEEVDLDNMEARPYWERKAPVVEPVQASRRRSFVQSLKKGSPSAARVQAHSNIDQRRTRTSEPVKRPHPLQRSRGLSRATWIVASHTPDEGTPEVNKIAEGGRKSRGSPDASVDPLAMRPAQETTQSPVTDESEDSHIQSSPSCTDN